MDDVRLLSTIEIVQIISTFLVVVGVAGEFVGSFMARPAQRRMDTKREMELARLRKGAADAELRARELEVLIQPRYLSAEQEQAITASMRRFSGSGMIITSHWIDAEAARLAEQIKVALNRAGIGIDGSHLKSMTVDKIGAYPEIVTGLFGGGGGYSGPNIHTGIEIWGTDRAAVKQLADSLASNGKLTAVVTPRSEDPFKNLYGDMALIVFVGSKPVPESK